MSNFVNELSSLKYMVTETLAAGSNYLFAKYDSVVNEEISSDETLTSTKTDSTSSSVGSNAYNRIVSEMVGLSAAQTVEQLEGRRKEISMELMEKTKISAIGDFEKFRSAIQKLNNKEISA